MEIEALQPAPLLELASDGNWCIVDPPTLEIVLPSVPLPTTQGRSRRLDAAHGRSPLADVRERRRYHVEWHGRDFDLYSDDETGATWLTVLFAYLHLPDEDAATRKAKVEARRAAREMATQQAIEADEYDTKKTPKKYPPPPIEDVDPSVETVIVAYVPVVDFIVGTWIKKHFRKETQALEIAGQTTLAKIRAGNRLSRKQFKKLDEKLNTLDKKEKTLENERSKTLAEVKTPILEKMTAEGIARAQVFVRGNPSSRKASEKPWHILQKTTAMLCDVRWRKAALERKRTLANLWPERLKQKSGGGATIAEELFSEGLLKLVEIVPSLPALGRKNKWEYQSPEHIAYYLTTVVKNAIYDYYKAARRFRGPPKNDKILARALRKRKPREYRTTIHKEANRDRSADPEWLYDGNTRYVFECDRSGSAALEGQEYIEWAIEQVCHDNKDRPLLWMKEQGIFTQAQIGEVLNLGEKQVRKRVWRMRKKLEKLLGLRRTNRYYMEKKKKDEDKNDEKEKKERIKRAAQKQEKRKLGEEFMVRWREAKMVADSVLPTQEFLLLPVTTDPPEFQSTSTTTADRAWHLRFLAITPNSRIAVRKKKSPPVSSPKGASGVV